MKFFWLLAYLDPGTGSYFLQWVLAGLLGFLFSAKLIWRYVKTFFTRRSMKGKHGKPKDR